MSSSCGKAIRLSRIIKASSKKSVSVAFDHGLDDGPMPGNIDPRATMAKLIEGGADAVLISPGIALLCQDMLCHDDAPALILRMDWTNTFRTETQLGFDEGRNVLIGQAEDALALGADAVLTFMFIGYNDAATETEEIRKNAELCRQAHRLGIPHIMEPMARGNSSKVNGREMDTDLISLHTRMAAELGADAIKTDYTGDPETYKKVIEACPAPILIAGGPKAPTLEDSLGMVKGAIDAGAAGILLGRNIIQAEDPVGMLKALRSIVHDGADVLDAIASHLK